MQERVRVQSPDGEMVSVDPAVWERVRRAEGRAAQRAANRQARHEALAELVATHPGEDPRGGRSAVIRRRRPAWGGPGAVRVWGRGRMDGGAPGPQALAESPVSRGEVEHGKASRERADRWRPVPGGRQSSSVRARRRRPAGGWCGVHRLWRTWSRNWRSGPVVAAPPEGPGW